MSYYYKGYTIEENRNNWFVLGFDSDLGCFDSEEAAQTFINNNGDGVEEFEV